MSDGIHIFVFYTAVIDPQRIDIAYMDIRFFILQAFSYKDAVSVQDRHMYINYELIMIQ